MIQLEVIGNIGADIKRIDENGTTFYTFNVADNRKVKGNDVTQWVRCNLNRPSEKLLPYLKKGQGVFVRGVPAFRIYDSAVHHCKMVSVDVFVNEIQLVGSAPQDTDAQANNSEGNSAPPF